MQVRDVCASQAVARELAMVLGRRPSDLPRIRKTEEVPPRYAITDAIMVVKGCSAKDARVELTRLRERYGDRATNCSSVRFRDSRSRIGANATPVAKTDALLEVVLLLTGSKAAAVRKHVVQVFVKYLGGDPGLAEQVLANRQAQEHLAATEPGHPAHAFGEAVEAAAGVNARPTDLRTACEAVALQTVIPAMTRVVDQALAAKFDQLARQAAEAQLQWQQVVVQRLDATLKEVARSTGRPVVNINTSAWHEEDLRKINVDAPEGPEDAARLRATASPLTKFLRERWQAQWVRAGLRHTSCSLQFSILMQARRCTPAFLPFCVYVCAFCACVRVTGREDEAAPVEWRGRTPIRPKSAQQFASARDFVHHIHAPPADGWPACGGLGERA